MIPRITASLAVLALLGGPPCGPRCVPPVCVPAACAQPADAVPTAPARALHGPSGAASLDSLDAASDTTVVRLGLAAFLDLVRDHHPLFRELGLAAPLAGLEREGLRTVEDWRLEAGPRWSYRQPVGTSAFSPESVENVTLMAGLERPFWSTGGRLSAGWQTSWISQELPPVEVPGPGGEPMRIDTGPGTLYRNRLSVRYSQPLWRNRGGDQDRLAWSTARHEVTAAKLQATEDQEAFLLDLAHQYLAWTRWDRTVSVAAERLRIAREQEELVREKLARNLVDRVDLVRAREYVVAARANLVRVRSALQAQRGALAVLAQLDDLRGYRPTYDLQRIASLPGPAAAFADLRPRSRVLRILAARAQRLDEEATGARDRTAPDLSLDVDLGLQGGDRQDHLGTWELDRPDLQVGMTFRQQLGAGTAETEAEALAVRGRQTRHATRRAELELEAAVTRLHLRLAGLAELLRLDREQVTLAARKAAAERELYREGRNPLNFVLQAQQAEQDARQRQIADATRYHELLLRYRELTDQLLVDGR